MLRSAPAMARVANMPKILVIEDDDELRGTIVSALESRRFKVSQASKGREGIESARREPPDLILCDLSMGGASDSNLFSWFRENPATAHVPFILMTGQPERDNRGDDVLVKPFLLSDLLAAIRRHVRQQPKKPSPAEAAKSPRPLKEESAPRVGSAPPRSVGEPSGRGPRPSVEQLEAMLALAQTLREEERTRLARAIHDDLSQTLTVLAIELSLLKSSLSSGANATVPGDCLPTLGKLAGLVNKLIRSAQEITARLRPKVLDEFGLVAALEWLTGEVRKNTGMRCELLADGREESLEPAVAGEVYRLAEDIILGEARHGDATEVSIRVAHAHGQLSLEICHNGSGRRADQSEAAAALGQLAARGQTERLGGVFEAWSSPGHGATIKLLLPLNR